MDVFDLAAKITLFSNVESQLKKDEGLMGRFAGSVGSTLGTAAKVGAAALTAAAGAVTAFANSSIGAATSFESAFTGVRKTVDATEEEYDALASWIMDASTKMASSKESIAATMEIAGQLGVRGVEGLEKFTETMVMLGDTTNLNAEEAAGALARFANIAGIGAEDMDRIGSTIVDLGNHFATTESDIVAMSTRLAAAGSIAGLSATDILALSTAMSSVGIQAEAGGTAMTQTLTKIAQAVEGEGEELNMIAEVAGVSAEEFAAAWKGEPVAALQAFIGGLGRMNEAGGSTYALLDELGMSGIRQSNMLQSLSLASDTLTSAVDTASSAYEENIALQKEANTRYATTESQAIQTAEAFKNLKITIGQELLPVYGQLMSYSSAAMNAMAEGLKNNGIEGLMESVGKAITDAIGEISKYIPMAFTVGSQVLGALVKGIVDNADQIMKGAVSVVEQFSQNIVNNADSIVNSAIKVVSAVGKGIIDAAPDLYHSAESIITTLGEQVYTLASNFFANSLPGLIESGLQMLMTFSGTLRENAGMMVDAGLSLIMSLAQSMIDNIPMFIETVPTIISNIAGIINDNAPKLLETGIVLIGQLIVGIVNAVPTLIAEFPKILKAVADVITAFNWVGLGQHIINFIKNGIVALFTAIPETLKTIGQNGLEWFKLLNWKTLGSDIIDLIKIGIESLFNAIPNTLKTIGKNALDWFKLLNWKTLGSDIIDLIKIGIESLFSVIPNALMNIGSSAVNAIMGLNWNTIGVNLISGIASGVLSAAGGLIDAVLGAVSSAWNALTGWLDIHSPSRKAKNIIGKNWALGIGLGFEDNMPIDEMQSTVKDAFGRIAELTPEIPVVYDATSINGTETGSVIRGGTITVNIYPSEGMDERELADMVSDRLREEYLGRRAVYA